MAEYFCMFMDRDAVKAQKKKIAKKNKANYPVISNKKASSIKDFSYGIKNTILWWDTVGSSEPITVQDLVYVSDS